MANSAAERIREEFSENVDRFYRMKERGRMLESEIESAVCAQQCRLVEEEHLGYCCDFDLDSQQWERLQADYRAWAKGRPCESTVGREWLRVKVASDARPVAEIKKEFFDIREALCLGIEEFEPVPEGIEKSAIGNPLYAGDRMMEFPCGELERLFAHLEEAAPGTNMALALDNGVEMRTAIESVAEEDGRMVMKARGYITEYMQPRKRPLEIIKRKGDPEAPFVLFTLNDDDLDFFQNNPRFKPYLDFLSAREARSIAASMKRIRALRDSQATT